MKVLKKAGQKFTDNGITDTKKQFTVASFFGESGVEYPTFIEAYNSNSKEGMRVCVKNKEHGGVHDFATCVAL